MEGRTAFEQVNKAGGTPVRKHRPRLLTEAEVEELLRDLGGRATDFDSLVSGTHTGTA